MEEIIRSVATGGFLIVTGLMFIFFHEDLRKINDSINRKLFGDLWSGIYAVEVVMLIRAAHTVTGVVLILFGSGLVLSIVQH